MRKIFVIVCFLLMYGAAFGQLSQFRMIGSGSWTTVNDSTYSSTVTIQADLTANGFLPTGITDTMKVFTQNGQRYRISSAINLTFSTADLTIIEAGGDWNTPIGQIMVYEDNDRDAVPNIPFGATGATAKMQEAVDSYNSSLTVKNPTGRSELQDSTANIRADFPAGGSTLSGREVDSTLTDYYGSQEWKGPFGLTTASSIAENNSDFINTIVMSSGVDGGIYNTNVLSSLWNDVSGTIPVSTVGDTVRLIQDLSGRGNNMAFSSTVADSVATLQQDELGNYYVHVPKFTQFSTESGIFPASKTIEENTFLSIAMSRTIQEGAVNFGFGSGGANYYGIAGLANSYRMKVASAYSAQPLEEIETRTATVALGVPFVLDVKIDTDSISSWHNNGNRHIDAPTNGGDVSEPTNWPASGSIIQSRWGINTRGGLSNATTSFYGAVIVNNYVLSDVERERINNYLLTSCGLAASYNDEFDLYGFIGQSNMMGVGDQSTSDPPRWDRALEYNDNGSFMFLSDPTQHAIAADYSLDGSLIPATAKEYFEQSGRKLLAVGAAASGEGIISPGPKGGWGEPSSLLQRFTAKVNNALSDAPNYGINAKLRGVVYLGGEQDAGAAALMTSQEYADTLIDFKNRIQDSLANQDLRLFLLSVDRRTDGANDAGFDTLRAAMVLAAQQDNEIFLALPYQDYVGQGLLGDVVHWNQTALNDAGQKVGSYLSGELDTSQDELMFSDVRFPNTAQKGGFSTYSKVDNIYLGGGQVSYREFNGIPIGSPIQSKEIARDSSSGDWYMYTDKWEKITNSDTGIIQELPNDNVSINGSGNDLNITNAGTIYFEGSTIQLEGDLNLNQGSGTPTAGTGFTVGSVNVQRSAEIICLSGSVGASADDTAITGGTTIILTLPTGYRPANTLVQPAFTNQVSDSNPQMFAWEISTNGEMKVLFSEGATFDLDTAEVLYLSGCFSTN